jgi:hypothetical protein
MTQRTFFLIAAALFSLIALGHAIRLLFGWHVMMRTWSCDQPLLRAYWGPFHLRSETDHLVALGDFSGKTQTPLPQFGVATEIDREHRQIVR